MRSVLHWVLLSALLTIHVLWSLVAPFVIVMMGLGVELLLFGVFLEHFGGKKRGASGGA